MTQDVAVLGVGLHPWGKWGRGFVEYGAAAARAALTDAELDWRDVRSIVGADTTHSAAPPRITPNQDQPVRVPVRIAFSTRSSCSRRAFSACTRACSSS